MTDPRQLAYEAKRAAWRADHPIGPFTSWEGLELAAEGRRQATVTESAEEAEAARVANLAAWEARLKAEGLWPLTPCSETGALARLASGPSQSLDS